jgi:hypothetical protein
LEIKFLGLFQTGAALDGGKLQQTIDQAFAACGFRSDIIEEALADLDGHFLIQQLRRAADGG